MYGYFRIATSTRARVYLAVERQTLKTPNSTNYPLSPSITPHRIQNRIVFCSPGSFFITLCKLFKSDKAFWRNTRPRNRTNFVKKGSHIRGGGLLPGSPAKRARAWYTICVHVCHYKTWHKNNFYRIWFHGDRTRQTVVPKTKMGQLWDGCSPPPGRNSNL